eukprot:2286019-Prymnesium_polylepis.1
MEGEQAASNKRGAEEAGLQTPAPDALRPRLDAQPGEPGAIFKMGAESKLHGRSPGAEAPPQVNGSGQSEDTTIVVHLSAVTGPLGGEDSLDPVELLPTPTD